MTRISEVGEDSGATQITATAEEVRQRLVDNQGAVKTAASYSSRVKERQAKTGALKGHSKPVGGAPPLDPEKMAAAMPLPRPKFDTSDAPPEAREVHEPPPEGTMSGVGSAYNVNRKIAHGTERPVSMREAGEIHEDAPPNTLSPDTVEALKMAQEGAREEEEAPSKAKDTKRRLEASEEDLVESMPFDFGELQKAKSQLLSDKRRKLIEGRLPPLQIEDMIVQRELTQTIPIVPNKLHVTLRTFNQREHLFCLRYVYKYGGSQLYVEELLTTCKLTCSVFAINGAPLPDHRVEVGKRGEEVDEKKFEEKMFNIASFPVQILADFSVQMIWFNDRVNDLLSLDNLKNG